MGSIDRALKTSTVPPLLGEVAIPPRNRRRGYQNCSETSNTVSVPPLLGEVAIPPRNRRRGCQNCSETSNTVSVGLGVPFPRLLRRRVLPPKEEEKG